MSFRPAQQYTALPISYVIPTVVTRLFLPHGSCASGHVVVRKLTKAIGRYQIKRAAKGSAEKTLRPLNDGVLVAEGTMT
jgi:hypothetical protein